MACNCGNKKMDIIFVKNIAKKYVRIMKESVQIYKIDINSKISYDFEPINNKRENIIEILQWEKE